MPGLIELTVLLMNQKLSKIQIVCHWLQQCVQIDKAVPPLANQHQSPQQPTTPQEAPIIAA
jgi:hypothetical protein